MSVAWAKMTLEAETVTPQQLFVIWTFAGLPATKVEEMSVASHESRGSATLATQHPKSKRLMELFA